MGVTTSKKSPNGNILLPNSEETVPESSVGSAGSSIGSSVGSTGSSVGSPVSSRKRCKKTSKELDQKKAISALENKRYKSLILCNGIIDYYSNWIDQFNIVKKKLNEMCADTEVLDADHRKKIGRLSLLTNGLYILQQDFTETAFYVQKYSFNSLSDESDRIYYDELVKSFELAINLSLEMIKQSKIFCFSVELNRIMKQTIGDKIRIRYVREKSLSFDIDDINLKSEYLVAILPTGDCV